jgi:hypothetical protein
MMATPEYQERPPIVGSLFKADQSAMSEEAVARVLGSKVVLPKKARVALMRFPDRLDPARKFHWGLYYFREETYLKSQQAYMDTLREELAASGRVQEAVSLPALMTPTDAGLPVLREAAVRLQADLLLIYRHTSDVYYKYGFVIWSDKAKGYCTCEVVLLDVRTGVIPFASVVTRDKEVSRTGSDYNSTDLMRRAEKEAVIETLRAVGQEVGQFLKAVP